MSEDILDRFVQLRDELKIIQKNLFETLLENDVYNIIRHSDIVRLEITEAPNDASLVRIILLNHADEVPHMTFEAPRVIVLDQSEDIIDIWLEAAQNEVIKAMRAKVNRFLRDFGREDFDLISNTIMSYDALIARGNPHSEISKIVATVTARKLGEENSKKKCTTEK